MKTRVFKKALFGGFDKKDVMDYIAEVSAENAKRKKEYEEAADELNGRITELDGKNAELSEQLDEAARVSRELSDKADELERTNAELASSNEELKAELDTQVGRIFTQARINAQSIVYEARIKADALTDRGEKILNDARRGVGTSADAINSARDELRALLEDTAEKLDRICGDMLKDAEKEQTAEEPESNLKKLPVKVSKRTPIARVK